jgi:hypothetical protein
LSRYAGTGSLRFLSLLACLALGLLAAIACGDDDDDDPANSPSVTATTRPSGSATPRPTITPELGPPTATPPTELAEFQPFAAGIAQAVAGKDTSFFLASPVLVEIECPNELMTECGPGPTPTVVAGILLGGWRSEAFPRTLNDFGASVTEYLGRNPRLRALAVDQDAEPAPTFYAVAAVDGDPESTAVFAFHEEQGAFRLYALIFAPVLGEEWLSGSCDDCYDVWVPWEGGPGP